MQVPKRKSEERRKFGPDDDHLSRGAIAKLEADLRRLSDHSRPKAVEDLTRAREMGDLSENAAYTEAKARLRGIDNRILSIQSRLKRAIPIEKGPTTDGKARIGSTVVVEVHNKQRTYEIVGSQETDPGTGKISYLSPLGSILMGSKEGHRVELVTADRTIVYTVIKVT